MFDFLTIQTDERSVRTTYSHMIELHGETKHVKNMWDMRDEGYVAKWGEPKSTGQYPITRSSNAEEVVEKVIQMKKKAGRGG